MKASASADQQALHPARLGRGAAQLRAAPRRPALRTAGALGTAKDPAPHKPPWRLRAQACSRLMSSSSTNDATSITTAMAVAPA